MDKRLATYTVILLIVIAVVGASLLLREGGGNSGKTHTATTSGGPPTGSSTTSINLSGVPHKALIYDSLAREFPDPREVSTLKKILESMGFSVTVYYGANATLDPLVGMGQYGLVIIRAHGAYNGDPSSGKPLGAYVYTGMYVIEAEAVYGVKNIEDGIRKGYYAPAVIPRPGVPLQELPKYLAVSPKFFRDIAGEMNKTIVFFTGCYGFQDDRLAKVIIDKGASAYIAWDGNVTWLHADEFLLEWARDLAHTGDPLRALEMANETVGPDPDTGAVVKIMVRSNG